MPVRDPDQVNSWPGGFQAQVDVTSTSTINGWTVQLTLAAGQSISSLWNGVNTGTSGAVRVQNASYNGNVSTGQSTNFGFVATGGSTPAPTGVTCSNP